MVNTYIAVQLGHKVKDMEGADNWGNVAVNKSEDIK